MGFDTMHTERRLLMTQPFTLGNDPDDYEFGKGPIDFKKDDEYEFEREDLPRFGGDEDEANGGAQLGVIVRSDSPIPYARE